MGESKHKGHAETLELHLLLVVLLLLIYNDALKGG